MFARAQWGLTKILEVDNVTVCRQRSRITVWLNHVNGELDVRAYSLYR
jgi:hypothetical protein